MHRSFTSLCPLLAAASTAACDGPCSTDVELQLTREDSGVAATLRAVTIDPGDPRLAIAVGDAGTIVTRDDDGVWTARDAGSDRPWYGVALADGIAVAVGAGGTIARSADAGATWTTLPGVTAADLHHVIGGTGGRDRWFAVGDGAILLAESAGEFFVPLDLPPGVGALRGLATDFEGAFLAVGLGGQVLRGEDDGERWSFVAESGPVDFLAAVHADEAEDGAEPWLLLGSDGNLYRDPTGAEPAYEFEAERRPLALSGPVLAGAQGWFYALDPTSDVRSIGARQFDVGDLRGAAWGPDQNLAVGDAGAVVAMRQGTRRCL